MLLPTEPSNEGIADELRFVEDVCGWREENRPVFGPESNSINQPSNPAHQLPLFFLKKRLSTAMLYEASIGGSGASMKEYLSSSPCSKASA